MRRSPRATVAARLAILHLATLTAFAGADARADEGMWQPSQLPALAGTLKQRGLAIDPKTLSDLTAYPMDAVVSLGFCTASFVSPEGLVVSNHHCGYGALQYNSTPQKNLINDGFLARTRAEELPADPTQRVYVTEQISDVTATISRQLTPGMDGYARFMAIDRARKQLVRDCEQPGYRCDVYTFSGGFSYQLIKQREIKDVRLVYAPPLSIGKFGGDIDNWMWPRHTGDFSYLRAYVAPDGSSAPYAKDNVPYRPKSWLKVNPRGVEAGDFVMVAGYPGRTDRYRLADELQSAIDWRYPSVLALWADQLAIVDAAAKTNPDVDVKYANFEAGVKNYQKNYQGNLEGLARSNALAIKRAQEASLDQWLAAQKAGGAVDGPALQGDIGRLREVIAREQQLRERDLILSAMSRLGLFRATYQIVRLADEKQKPDLEREDGFQQRDEIRVLGSEQRLDHEMIPAVEQPLFVDLLQRYVALPPAQHLGALDQWLGGATDKAALNAKAATLYTGTKLTDTATRIQWLSATPAQIRASDDPWLTFMSALMPDLLAIEHQQKAFDGEEAALRPRLMAAMTAFNAAQGKPVYPDANSSLRVTFGTVQGYQPRDAVTYAPFTSAAGIVEKNTGVEPFNAPLAELQAIRARAFDGFASPKQHALPVNFLSNLDITGGNSGSPTLDRNGRLVGLAFDGNWEGVSSGWLFNPKETRTIQVDVRYMLWVMHHLDHADNLLEEMNVPVPH
ncbi:MAG: S46 family peptidase [Janthinobacterium lividum]